MRVFGKEFRIFKHDRHGPVPLMMHPRMYWVRYVDLRVRAFLFMITRREYRSPKYMRPQRTPEERAEQHEAIRAFLGGMSPVPFVSRYYREQARLSRLASDSVSEEEKQEMRAAGPICTSEDEAYMLMSDDEADEFLQQVAENLDHPDHAAVVAWLNGETETKRWLV